MSTRRHCWLWLLRRHLLLEPLLFFPRTHVQYIETSTKGSTCLSFWLLSRTLHCKELLRIPCHTHEGDGDIDSHLLHQSKYLEIHKTHNLRYAFLLKPAFHTSTTRDAAHSTVWRSGTKPDAAGATPTRLRNNAAFSKSSVLALSLQWCFFQVISCQ